MSPDIPPPVAPSPTPSAASMYAAHHSGDYAAQDQAGTQRGEPAENDAYPAGAQLGLTPLAIGGALLARVSYPAWRGRFFPPVRHLVHLLQSPDSLVRLPFARSRL